MIREYLDRAGAQVLANAIKNGKYEKITYQNLVTKRGSQELVPGKLYRITDYNTTTALAGTAAAGHVFDLIVMAIDKDKLSEEACAVTRAGATSYWENSNLSAWRIWYCLDNDTNRFAWADTTNGKGVIYRMIDEWGNDCPYDFKNILYTGITTAGGNCYTFSLKYDETFEWENVPISDASILGNFIPYSPDTAAGVMSNNGTITWIPSQHPNIMGCRNNKIEPCIFTTTTGANTTQSKQTLNKIILFACAFPAVVSGSNTGTGFGGIYSNTFGPNCQDILLGLGDNGGPGQYFATEKFYGNTFGPNCYGFRMCTNLLDNQFGAGVNNIRNDASSSAHSYMVNNIFEPEVHHINMDGALTMRSNKFDTGCSYVATSYNIDIQNTEVDSSVVGTSDSYKLFPGNHPYQQSYKITYTTVGAQTIVI